MSATPRRALAALAACLALAATSARGAATSQRLTLADGKHIAYTLRGVSLSPPDTKLAPTSAPATAELLIRDLAHGKIERAALLSNAPKQRYALLRGAYAGWTAQDFKRTYGRYFKPPNRIVAEATIGAHHLVLWRLADIHYLAGYYFVDVEGKTYLDDIPNPVRAQLEQVLRAYRDGRLRLP